jgi:hypothetical protein
MPDLGTYTEWMRLVRRDAGQATTGTDPATGLPNGTGVTAFNANLVRPSSYVGLHTALVAYDVNEADGSVVGANPTTAVVAPGASKTVQYYAGDLDIDLASNLVATPVELGGAIISPADKMKQGMKGMVGAFIVEPKGATWNDGTEVTFDHQKADKTKTRLTRASATVNANGTAFRDFANVVIKGQGHRYVDGRAVENVAAEGGILAEDTEDSGQMSINYGSEPMWFRFGLMPNVPFGNEPGLRTLGGVPNAGDAYSNLLTTGGVTFGEPSTPVFEAAPGQESRIRLVTPYAQMRASVFMVHGHVWQRAPYGCGVTGVANGTQVGLCLKDARGVGNVGPGSTDIGQSRHSFYMGAQDLNTAYAHFDVVLPSAGGTGKVTGDYLLRDTQPLGNLGGLWDILRVKDPATP